MSQRLFERVIAVCDLSPLLGPGTLRRALRDVGADPATATVDDYCRAIPRLEARLRSFLPEAEAAQRARSILHLKSQLCPAPHSAPSSFDRLRASDSGRPGWVDPKSSPESGPGRAHTKRPPEKEPERRDTSIPPESGLSWYEPADPPESKRGRTVERAPGANKK